MPRANRQGDGTGVGGVALEGGGATMIVRGFVSGTSNTGAVVGAPTRMREGGAASVGATVRVDVVTWCAFGSRRE